MMKHVQVEVLESVSQRLTTALTLLTPTLSQKDMRYLTALLANIQADIRDMKERI